MGRHDWGATDENELIKAVHVALEYGINFFDTADIYGLGVSEDILGKALRDKRQKAIIATKFGVRTDEEGMTFYDNSPVWIKQAVEGSLFRLGTDFIDVYQLHYWDRKIPIDETLGVLSDLSKAGKIRAFGVTNIDLVDHGFTQPMDSLASFSFEYSLAKREFEPAIFRNHEKLGICFLSWGSLGQGILSGKYNLDTKLPENDRRRLEVYANFHDEKLVHNLRIVDYMRSILPHYESKTVTQMAIRWILDQIPCSIALTGIKRPSQLIENCGALSWKLTSKHQAKLCELSHFKEKIGKNDL
jgi:aryl-alcohol dehydrogenase-like predicted oxidoreductase